MDDAWETVTVVGTDEEAALIEGYLTAQGLTAEVESLVFHQEPVTFGRLGEARVRVPAHQADEARRLLAERDAEAASDGGEKTAVIELEEWDDAAAEPEKESGED